MAGIVGCPCACVPIVALCLSPCRHSLMPVCSHTLVKRLLSSGRWRCARVEFCTCFCEHMHCRKFLVCGKFCSEYISLEVRRDGTDREPASVRSCIRYDFHSHCADEKTGSERENGLERQGGIREGRPWKAHRLLFESIPCHLLALRPCASYQCLTFLV